MFARVQVTVLVFISLDSPVEVASLRVIVGVVSRGDAHGYCWHLDVSSRGGGRPGCGKSIIMTVRSGMALG